MPLEGDKELLEALIASREKARGYADFFGWGANRNIEEWGVLYYLSESLTSSGVTIFNSFIQRERPNDPPDCEALDESGQRVAIEVTELVDEEAIKSFKTGEIFSWANWDVTKFRNRLNNIIKRKDSRFDDLKDPPYKGGYFLVIFTDEPMLKQNQVNAFLDGYFIKNTKHLSKVFLLLSYDPSIKKCPYFELSLG